MRGEDMLEGAQMRSVAVEQRPVEVEEQRRGPSVAS